MGKLTVTSNLFNERHELDEWVPMVKAISDNGVIVVDSGSTDGTIDYLKENGIIVIESKIIVEQGYGPARNHLMQMTREKFPESEWMIFLDGDERILERDFHMIRVLKEYLVDDYDVVAFPRIDWHDRKMTKSENDINVSQDWQARMCRVWEGIEYKRMLHEQVQCKAIYANINNPVINHFHRETPKKNREVVSRLCAKLHNEDEEWGSSYPVHPKEKAAFERYQQFGLTGGIDE